MPSFVKRITEIGNNAVRLAQDEHCKRGVANIYCLHGTIIRQQTEDVQTAFLNMRRARMRACIGCARKYMPNFTSTDDLMKDLREGEE